MPDRQRAKVISPADANTSGEAGGFPFSDYGVHILAQGDSWFSLGEIPPWQTTRILDELTLTRSTVIVNCALPGAKLARMTDTSAALSFDNELAGRLAKRWHAILFSGGGNDLIEAAGASPEAPVVLRLLRTKAERGAAASAVQHISEPGWRTFERHLGAVFHRLIDRRDSSNTNRGVPLVLHNYARVVPRPAGVALGISGPWLLRALQRYEVAPAMLQALSDELTTRLSRLLQALVRERLQRDPQANVHLVDTLGQAGVTPAQPDTAGESGDWINEIHLTRDGYRKCARVWEPVIDAVTV